VTARRHGTASRGLYLGYAETLVAACLWGSSGIFAVHLFRLGVSPESVALLRPLIGVGILAAILAVARPSALRVDARALLVLGLAGGIAVGVFQIAYLLSIEAAGVPTTVALIYLSPALVAVASGPLLGEWPDARRIALVAVTVLGVWLSVIGSDERTAFDWDGIGWGVLAGVSYASYTLFGRYAAPRFGPVATAVYSTGLAGLVLAAALPLLGRPVALPSGAAAWALLVAFAALSIAAAQLLFFDALNRVDAGGVSAATAAEPVVAAVLATVMLDQGLAAIGWIGIALVVIGVAGVGFTTVAAPGRS
jgi:DME family drug/metabolite transporter